MRIIITFLIGVLALSGCSDKAKKRLGITSSGPNEYKVETNNALEIPPHFNLPEPEKK